MDTLIKWMLTNVFTWTVAVGIIFGLIRQPIQMNRCANTLRYLFLWYVGIAFTYSGYMHIFLGDFSAESIGWASSPFQFEVGLANWSLALLGYLAFFKKEKTLWLASVLAVFIFTVGAGMGHVYQLVTQHNTAISNAGLILYTDLLTPILLLVLWFRSSWR